MGHIANIYYERGDLDEALCIWQEEELPVVDKLADSSGRAGGDGPGDRNEAKVLLEEALTAATKDAARVIAASSLATTGDA